VAPLHDIQSQSTPEPFD